MPAYTLLNIEIIITMQRYILKTLFLKIQLDPDAAELLVAMLPPLIMTNSKIKRCTIFMKTIYRKSQIHLL
jgi:hypothetical protein